MTDRTYLDVRALQHEIAHLGVLYPELADDEQLRADVLEGETDFHSIMSRIIAGIRNANAFADAVKAMRDQLMERQAAHQRRAEAMRLMAQRLMETAQLRKLTLPEATVSVRLGSPSVVITDEQAIPAKFQRHKIEIDKTALKEALKAGETVAGAALSNSPDGLTIRWT